MLNKLYLFMPEKDVKTYSILRSNIVLRTTIFCVFAGYQIIIYPVLLGVMELFVMLHHDCHAILLIMTVRR